MNIERIGKLAVLLEGHGVISIVACVSAYRAARDRVRTRSLNFMEVYVNAPLALCEQRDVKGMYHKARSGELPHFTGIDDPYEPPLHPEVECLTEFELIEDSVGKILSRMYSFSVWGDREPYRMERVSTLTTEEYEARIRNGE